MEQRLEGGSRGRSLRVAHVFPTFAVGGGQARFAAIANHFGTEFRHIVVSLDGDQACRERLRTDLDIAFPQLVAPKGAFLSNTWHFWKALRRWRPDVLVTCNWGAIEFALAGVLTRLRHAHVIDGFGSEEHDTQVPRRVLARRLVLRHTRVVLPSRTLVRLAADVWKLPPRVIRYVPNGVDLDRFAAAAEGLQRGAPVPVIGTVAALRAEKNLARLVRAFALLVWTMPARLIIVGDGPERPALAALAGALGVGGQVELAGQHQDTPAFYARFDAFAMSSDTEQMPLAVIEAMASGLPVVSTDVGDVRTMVAEDNTPFIVPQSDAAMAEALRALLSNPVRCATIGAANLSKARREFGQARMFAAHGALWRGADFGP